METAIEKASMTPARVDPCLPSFKKTSPSAPSSYAPAVIYPSAPPTLNEVVRDGRDFGSRLRVARAGAALSTTGSSFFFALPSESG